MSRNRLLGRDLQVGVMIRSLFMNALGSTAFTWHQHVLARLYRTGQPLVTSHNSVGNWRMSHLSTGASSLITEHRHR